MPKEKSFSPYTFKYLEIFLSWLFKYSSRCYQLKTEKQVFKNPCKEFFRFANLYRFHNASKGIICRVSSKQKDIDLTCDILTTIYEKIESSELCELATAEVLAKVLAYRNMKKGQKVPIPTLDDNGPMTLIIYTVDTVINLWNNVCAFGLISTDIAKGAPILLYRGTDFSILSEGGRASIICDLDPKGPGRALFEHGESEIKKWLKIASLNKKKARMIGHSLGATFVAYTLINDYDYISTKSYEISYAFNLPGVSEDLINKWNSIQKEKTPTYKGFVSRGDLVSKFGLLFGDIHEISLNKPLTPITAHEILFFAQPLLYLHEVDLNKENISYSRKFYSNIHKQTSSLIYEFGL